MHQINKDPNHSHDDYIISDNSPSKNLTKFELQRYLDYPSESIEGFDNVSEAYQIMTSQNFTDFANKINTKFGIK